MARLSAVSTGYTERLLLAELDYQAAQSFRAVAEEALKQREGAADLYRATGDHVPPATQAALTRVALEYKRLNRICLRHAARRLDASLHAEGQESEMESLVILFDIQNPIVAAI